MVAVVDRGGGGGAVDIELLLLEKLINLMKLHWCKTVTINGAGGGGTVLGHEVVMVE